MAQHPELEAATIRETVRERYANAVTAVLSREPASCCGGSSAESSCCGGGSVVSPIVIGNYTPGETAGLPEEAVLASFAVESPLTGLGAGGFMMVHNAEESVLIASCRSSLVSVSLTPANGPT